MRRRRNGEGQHALGLGRLVGEPPLEELDEEGAQLDDFREGNARAGAFPTVFQLETEQMKHRGVGHRFPPGVKHPVDQDNHVVEEPYAGIADVTVLPLRL